jgi:hypothetical protein
MKIKKKKTLCYFKKQYIIYKKQFYKMHKPIEYEIKKCISIFGISIYYKHIDNCVYKTFSEAIAALENKARLDFLLYEKNNKL